MAGAVVLVADRRVKKDDRRDDGTKACTLARGHTLTDTIITRRSGNTHLLLRFLGIFVASNFIITGALCSIDGCAMLLLFWFSSC